MSKCFPEPGLRKRSAAAFDVVVVMREVGRVAYVIGGLGKRGGFVGWQEPQECTREVHVMNL